MASGGPNPQNNRYTHNDTAFVEYNTRLQSNNLPTFTTAATKFTEWLGSDKAYYPNARGPIVTIVESAHVNICRVQGNPSVPFKLDKAFPGLDPWYQPYLSLLKQVGSHLNHFEPELRARLLLLVENAGIKIVQVPTLTENTISQRRSPQPTKRKNDHATPTGAKDNTIPAGASAQATSPSTQMQQSGTILPVTNPQPLKRGRRKLNRAIFDVDTAAALRTKAQAEPPTVGTNSPPLPEGTAQQEATGVAISPDPLLKVPADGVPVVRPLVAGDVAEEQLRYQSKEDEPSPEVVVAGPSRTPGEDPRPPEEVTVEQLHEAFPVNPLREAELGDDKIFRNRKDQPEHLGSPTTGSLPEDVEANNTGKEPDLRPATPEPITMEPRTNSPVSTSNPEEAGRGEKLEPPQQFQAASETVEWDMGGEVPSHPSDNVGIHGVIRRREGDSSVGGEQRGTPLEPPAKRIRTESEDTTTMTLSMPTPRVPTPRVLTRGPSSSVSPTLRSLSATHGVQRPSSDVILDSDNETTPAPWSAKGTTDEDTVHEPQTENPVVQAESHEERVTEETPMSPAQDLPPVSPETKSNPFTASRIFLCSPVALPPPARATVVPDVGRIPLHPPTTHDTLGVCPTVTSQASQQESQTRKTYIFSPAEIRTLVASRGSDEGSGPNKLVFPLDWNFINGITKWRNYKAGQGPLEGSFCLSLACYPVDSVAPLMSTAKDKPPFDALIRQARIKSSWPSGPGFCSALKDGSGKSYPIPPFLALQTTEDNFVDISESAVPGTNTYTIEDDGQSLSNWLFAVYVHTPTVAYFDAAQAKVDKAKKWVETLKSFTTYSLPPVDWDALQGYAV